MTTFVHSFFYFYFVVPLLSLLAFILCPFHQKIRNGLRDRNWGLPRKYPQVDPSKDLYWFHCSSGEIEYAKPLIRELKLKYPDCFILVSWHSPSAKKLAQKLTEVDLLIASPWEFQSSYDKFIKHFKPKRLFVARTDIWPAQLKSAKKHSVTSHLFSATFVKSSARYKNIWARSFYRWAHAFFDEIYCVSEEDKENFLLLNYPGKIFVTGDTRYEQVLWRLENSPEPKVKFPKNTDHKLNLILGSSWEEDEKIILPAWLKHRSKYRLIVTPHEPSKSHLSKLDKFFKTEQIPYQLYSDGGDFTKEVLIVDEIGVLASLYPLTDLAFIGGSFKSSIHSVMEALAAGLVCFFGPYYKNNREAIEFKEIKFNENLAACNSLNNQAELERFLENYHQFHQEHKPASLIKDKILQKTGTTEALLDQLID